MKKRNQTSPEIELFVAGKDVGRKLHQFIYKYGELNTRTAIDKVRHSIRQVFCDDEEGKRIKLEDAALEVMYHDYVASCKDPVFTFIEYKALAGIITNVM